MHRGVGSPGASYPALPFPRHALASVYVWLTNTDSPQHPIGRVGRNSWLVTWPDAALSLADAQSPAVGQILPTLLQLSGWCLGYLPSGCDHQDLSLSAVKQRHLSTVNPRSSVTMWRSVKWHLQRSRRRHVSRSERGAFSSIHSLAFVGVKSPPSPPLGAICGLSRSLRLFCLKVGRLE